MGTSCTYVYLGGGVGLKQYHTSLSCRYNYYRQTIAHHYGLAPRCWGLEGCEFFTEHLPIMAADTISAEHPCLEVMEAVKVLSAKLAAIGIHDVDLDAYFNCGYRAGSDELLAIDLGNGPHDPTELEIFHLIRIVEVFPVALG